MFFFKKEGDYLKSLLKHHRLKLLQARHTLVARDEFEGESIEPWYVKDGDFHKVTVDTNEDKKAGIEESLLINAAGSYTGGMMERKITLKNPGEVVFERYVRNDDKSSGKNILNFYVNGSLKLSVEGPAPWRRTQAFSLPAGDSIIGVEYLASGTPNKKSGVVDTFEFWESKDLDTLITNYTPARPIRNLVQNKTLRGYSRFQEMSASDTSIKFTAAFKGIDFHEFIANTDGIFYFLDEFGVIYRGIFPENIEPDSIALNALYVVNLEMIAPQKTGVGFV